MRIWYRYQGQTFSVTAWSGIMACVAPPSHQIQASKLCSNNSGKFTTAVRNAAGLSS